MHPIALTIAGSDSGGGAGIQADLKTFHQFGVYGVSAITLVTVQNTRRVSRVELMEVSLVREQIDAVFEDLPPLAIKTGALGSATIVEAVASSGFAAPLVVDPVTISKHGSPLMDVDARRALRRLLLPKAALVTPNLDEAAELSGMRVDSPEGMRAAAVQIALLGAASVLVKGGHLAGDAVDILFHRGRFTEFTAPRVDTRHTHGTGCTYSAAITALLALGVGMEEAVGTAKRFVTEAIRTAPGLGGGAGPLNHFAIISFPTMTKVQKHFRLQRPLDESLMAQIAEANSIYGIERIVIEPSREDLLVEYDASRLRAPDVESALLRAGVPVVGLA
jgi:hydroxymethylpyrimidine/phosphomethylpyrimidine kinase